MDGRVGTGNSGVGRVAQAESVNAVGFFYY